MPNITVAVGSDAVMPCVVRNLQDYKVGRRTEKYLFDYSNFHLMVLCLMVHFS